MASRDWHRAAVEAERQRDNAIAQLEYEQANRRKNDAEIAHERDDFIKELETANNGMRAALVAIQELHKPVEIEPSETICEECSTLRAGWYEPITEWPCPTRKLADEALGGGERG